MRGKKRETPRLLVIIMVNFPEAAAYSSDTLGLLVYALWNAQACAA